MPHDLTIVELAAAARLEPRTVRSWVSQGLLSGPLSLGPTARYPADSLERLLAIRHMRDRLHMPLGAIRQRLLVATPAELHGLAGSGSGPEAEGGVSASASALDYIRNLRAKPDPTQDAAVASPPRNGLAGLEHTLGNGRTAPARKARADHWLRIPVTPEVELTVRGPLEPEAVARLERCADLIRDIILGREP